VIDQSVRRVLAAKIRLLGIQPPDSANAADQKSATDETIINHKGNDDVWAKLIAEGKFDTPAGARRPDADRVLQDPAHDALALKLARESIVLLKNDGNALPLDRTKLKKILIVGPFGDTENRGGYSGGTSHPYIKLAAALKQSLGDAVQVDFARGCGVESERKPRADKVDFQAVPTIGGDDAQLLAEARARAADADVIIAVVGHSRGQAGENLDRDSLDLVGGQEPLVEAMHATDKPVVVVLENGAPLTIGWIKQNIPAIVESWYGGQDAGRAIADVLLGDYNPGGKLPVTFPKNLGQIPCYYNHLTITGPSDYYQSKWADLFCFGYGLSYTTFAYSNLQITPNAIDARGTAKISATIENTGKRAGDEVVQMYIRQGFTSVERPVEELKGFARVSLQPGEKKTVEFPIGFDQIKFWKDGKWVVEPGDVEIRVGSSSQDIRQKGRLRVGGNPQ
jgi:beta-glucosidase